MNTKTNIVTAAAILTVLAVPSIASAEWIVPPASYVSNQMETAPVPADAYDSVVAPRGHRGPFAPQPYGQW